MLQLDEDDAGGKQHEALPKDLPKVPPMFQNNVGINKEVFDRNHPYFTTIPAPVLERVLKASGELEKFKPERLEILLLDRSKQFLQHSKYGKNGRVLIHRLADQSSNSFAQELAIAIQKAKEGIAVEMLPELRTEEVEFFYDKIFPKTIKKPKHPDFRFNQKDYADLKSTTGFGKSTLKNNIKDAAHQCDYAIIDMRQISSWKQVKIDCRIKFKDHKSLHTIEVISGNMRKVYKRKKLGL